MKAKLLNAQVLVSSVALGLGLGSFGCGSVRAPAVAANTKVDQVFSKWNHPDLPGAAVVVVKDGAVIYQRGYGSANLEQRTPITSQTVFDAASVAKQFTGLAIAILVERGKLTLDDDVRKHLPEVPDFGTPITVRHLLYHTSGLRDWFETLVLSGIAPSDLITMDTIIEMVRRQRDLDFAPGEEHSYCNTGYNLLAAIVAKVTKQSFRRWTDENLFQPLGMMHTHFSEDPTEVIPNRAAYYVWVGKGELRQFISQLAAPGSSSLMTTTEDMGKWLINFGTARVGGAGAIQMMQQSGKLNSGKEVDYGFGLGLDNYHGMRRAYHTGSWGGDCAMAWLPEKRFGVAVFANAPDANPARIAFAVANIYLGFPEPAHQPQPLADKSAAKRDVPKPVSKAFAAYVGDYWSEELEVVYHIEVRNGELMMGNRFDGWSKLLPKSHDRFDTEPRPGVFVAPAVDFTRDPASKVNGMKLTGGRIRNLRFTRVSLVQAGAE